MSKVKVHDLAKKYGFKASEFVEILGNIGFPVSSYQDSVEEWDLSVIDERLKCAGMTPEELKEYYRRGGLSPRVWNENAIEKVKTIYLRPRKGQDNSACADMVKVHVLAEKLGFESEEFVSVLADVGFPVSSSQDEIGNDFIRTIEERIRDKDATMSNAEGRWDNQYEKVEKICETNHTVVYRCFDVKKAAPLALKILRPDSVQEKEMVKRELRALKDLEHPNIVSLLDFHEDGGESYFALEWIPKSLKDLKSAEHDWLLGWDDFFPNIARKVLEALCYMHDQNIVHRDIKPSNILISDGENPQCKIADFGISKYMESTFATVTLDNYNTRMFSPPHGHQMSLYQADIWSCAAMFLWCLSDEQFDTCVDFTKVEANIPPKIATVLRDIISIKDGSPRAAHELLRTLERVSGARAELHESKGNVGVVLAETVREFIHENGGLPEMLGSSVYYSIPDTFDHDGRFEIYSEGYKYGVDRYSDRKDILSGKVLYLLYSHRLTMGMPDDAIKFPYSICEASNPSLHLTSLYTVYGELVERWAESLKASKGKYLIKGWQNWLDARLNFEKDKYPSFTVANVRPKTGNTNEITLSKELSDEDYEQLTQHSYWLLSSTGAKRKQWRGSVFPVDKDRSKIMFEFADQNPGDAIANYSSMSLLADISMTKSSIDRQRNTLSRIENGQSPLYGLAEKLKDPSEFPIPLPSQGVTVDGIDDDKLQAISSALASKDFYLVSGPPGTGKTKFIVSLIEEALRSKPDSKIILSSQTHIALDHAIEKLKESSSSCRIVRYAKNEDAVSRSARDVLPREISDRNKKKFQECRFENFHNWATSKEIDSPQTIISKWRMLKWSKLNRGKGLLEEKIKRLKLKIEPGESMEGGIEDSDKHSLQEEIRVFKNNLATFKGNEHMAWSEVGKGRGITSFCEEIGISESDIHDYLEANKHPEEYEVLDWQHKWSLRQADSKSTELVIWDANVIAGTCIGLESIESIEEMKFDLCIIDEAAKALAVESLVPISRSNKSVLVGDIKQLPPFNEGMSYEFLAKHKAEDENNQKSLFSYLLENGINEKCHTLLSMQYRMNEHIGQMISQCFYDSKLFHGRGSLRRDILSIFDTSVLWIDTSNVPDATHHMVNRSLENNTEANIVEESIDKINNSVFQDAIEVLVLTPYQSQKKLLARRLEAHRGKNSMVSIDIATVDGSQGREADIVILSLTRNKQRATPGFLAEYERINVALSRGKDLLIIVGSKDFAMNTSEPLRRVIDYVNNPSSKGCKMISG